MEFDPSSGSVYMRAGWSRYNKISYRWNIDGSTDGNLKIIYRRNLSTDLPTEVQK